MITKKDLDSTIENAVGQISHAVVKALENVATKDDLRGVETRLDGVETRLGGTEKLISCKKQLLINEKAVFATP